DLQSPDYLIRLPRPPFTVSDYLRGSEVQLGEEGGTERKSGADAHVLEDKRCGAEEENGDQGYVKPICNLLRQAGVLFNDVQYSFKTAPNYNWDKWLKAILRYLGAKYGFWATTLEGQAREDIVEEEIVDLRDRFVRASYYKNYNFKKEIQEKFG
ncbi:Glutathione S-transferase Mu 3, partial [Tyrophagus putrescentiae]